MFKPLVVAMLAATLLAAGCAAPITGCLYSTDLFAQLDTGDANLIRIVAGAGSLHIEGDASATAVTANGTACASSQALLDQIGLEADRPGAEIRLTHQYPSQGLLGSQRLDLTIRVPTTLALVVHDGSGDLTIQNVGALELIDGSGDITLTRIAGDLRVTDGSGDTLVDEVGGHALVERDGSGSIEFRDVQGDFTVQQDGSGSVRYSNVGGRINLPQD